MIVRHLDKVKFHRACNNFGQPLLPTDDMEPPFRSAFGTIPPNGFIRSHKEQKAETLFIIKGNGEIIANGKTQKVSEYDVVSIPAFSRKLLTNIDKEKDLVFLSVCWIEGEKRCEIDHYVLLTPPQKPNEKMQLYHTADIFKRFVQLDGKDVSHIIGGSDFLRDVPANAMPYEDNLNFVSEYFSSDNCDSEVDHYMKASQISDIQRETKKLVQMMYDRGLFISKKDDANDFQQLKEGKERLFFPLSKYRNELKDYYKKIDMNEPLRDFCEAVLQGDLPDVPVSFHNNGKISMPITKYKNQKISVLFEMLAYYISSVSKMENDNELPSSKTKKVQFLDIDNYFVHVVVLPAVYMALNPKKKFVDSYVTNECPFLENRKPLISKSNTILADDVVQKYSPDIIRSYLFYKNDHSNFSKFEFEEFVSIFKRVMIDYLNEIKMEFQSVGNNLSISLHHFSEKEKGIIQLIQKTTAISYDYYQINTFSPKDIVKNVCKLLKKVKQFNQMKSPIANKLAINFLVIRHISCILHPITPGLSEKINQMLFQSSKVTWLDQVKILRDYFIDPTITFE